MKVSCEIVCVGTELLLGDIVNTNAQFLARGLAEIGVDTYWQTVVGDNPGRLRQALQLAMSRADVVITTGGLGPTVDDLTKETVAEFCGCPLEMNQACLDELTDFFKRIGRPMCENNKKQAMMPAGCQVLANPQGTAPGALCRTPQGGLVIMMPGPPREMQPMFTNHVAPYLAKMSGQVLVSQTLHVVSMPESLIDEKLRDLLQTGGAVTVAPYAKSGECTVRVTAKAADKQQANELLEPVVREVRGRLGEAVYGVDVANFESHIVELLRKSEAIVSIADLYTAGNLAHRLGTIAGSEQVLGLCLTAVQLSELRQMMSLEIPEVNLEPSQFYEQMAQRVSQWFLDNTGSTHALVLLPGPEGQTGTEAYVYLAAVDSHSELTRVEYPAGRDRYYLRLRVGNQALELLRFQLTKRAVGSPCNLGWPVT